MNLISTFSSFFLARSGTNGKAEGLSTEQQYASQMPGMATGVEGVSNGWKEPPANTFANYRKMSRHPTLALAEFAATAAIWTAGWSVDADEGVPEDRVQFISDVFLTMRETLIRQMTLGLRYGFQPFEVVWEADGSRWLPSKIRPLLPDLTKILIDDVGRFCGFKQNELTLDPINCLCYTHDREGDNFYGVSRHERAAIQYQRWMDTDDRAGAYHKKTAGVISQLHYPPGWSMDAAGRKRTNQEIAVEMMIRMADSQSAIFPNEYARGDDPLTAAQLAGKSQWAVSFLDPGGSNFAQGFIDERRYRDSLLLRSWLIPERAVVEGQFGTKAEAESHGDIATLGAEMTHQEIVRHLNWFVVDDVLAVNFGEETRGTVRICAQSLSDDNKAAFRSLFSVLVADPAIRAKVAESVDWESVSSTLGLPIREDRPIEIEPAEETDGAATPVQPAANEGLMQTPAALTTVAQLQKDFYAGQVSREMAISFCQVMFQMSLDAAGRLFPEEAEPENIKEIQATITGVPPEGGESDTTGNPIPPKAESSPAEGAAPGDDAEDANDPADAEED